MWQIANRESCNKNLFKIYFHILRAHNNCFRRNRKIVFLLKQIAIDDKEFLFET